MTCRVVTADAAWQPRRRVLVLSAEERAVVCGARCVMVHVFVVFVSSLEARGHGNTGNGGIPSTGRADR